MGFLVGRSLFIEGYFARVMYRSLHLMHEVALYGKLARLAKSAGAEAFEAV